MSNAKNFVLTPLASIMADSAFVQGFISIKIDEPFNPDLRLSPQHAWRYERGRMFGAIFNGSLFASRSASKLNPQAMNAYRAGCKNGDII